MQNITGTDIYIHDAAGGIIADIDDHRGILASQCCIFCTSISLHRTAELSH